MDKDYSNMSIWKKIQLVKKRLLEANLKKTGENSFSGFKYYELADFTPTIINLCNEVGLFTKFTFDNEMATLTIINSDKQDQVESYTSPMRNLQLKGCNDIQALGGVETYSRRYLYMSAFDIVENDMFDGQAGSDKNKPKEEPKETKKEKKKILAEKSQIENLKKLYTEDELTQALSIVKKEKLEDLTIYEASSLISKRKNSKKEEGKENE